MSCIENARPPSPVSFPAPKARPRRRRKNKHSINFYLWELAVQVGTPTIVFKPLAAHEKSAGDAPGDPAQSVLYSIHPGCDPGATGHGPHRPLCRARDGSGAASTTQAETRGGRRNSAPLVKGFVEALRTSRARSCLRPVDAEWMAPLALMIGPHGPSPPSPYRARTGADTCTGFQAYPRVHITSSAPSI